MPGRALDLLPGGAAIAVTIGPHKLADIIFETTQGIAYAVTNRRPEVAAGIQIR